MRRTTTYLLISLCLSGVVACERSAAWKGPLAARTDSAIANQTLTCVKGAAPSAAYFNQEDSIQACRAGNSGDVIIVWAATDGDVRALELYHRAPREQLPALAGRVVREAKGPNARLMIGCPDYPTEGAWVWRDSTLYHEVEVEPDSNFVRESVYRGESPMAYNCRLARIGG